MNDQPRLKDLQASIEQDYNTRLEVKLAYWQGVASKLLIELEKERIAKCAYAAALEEMRVQLRLARIK